MPEKIPTPIAAAAASAQARRPEGTPIGVPVYLERAVQALRNHGYPVNDTLLQHLSPLAMCLKSYAKLDWTPKIAYFKYATRSLAALYDSSASAFVIVAPLCTEPFRRFADVLKADQKVWF
jgi:hypothetical protein